MEVVTQVGIGLDAARAASAAAIQRARELGVRVVVAVVDPAGTPLVQLRMPGAPLLSSQIALDKAYTAVSFGRDTGDWQELLDKRSEAVRAGLMKQPRFLAMAGGVVMRVDGELVGAVGVSGASEDIDEDCARAGLRAISASAACPTAPARSTP